jgi:L-amino acid N-acyltransferase YncA
MAQKYDVAVVKINKRNDRSLRLAKFFGFEKVGHEKHRIVLEKKLWVI